MKILTAAILLLQCQCLMYGHFHDKALDIRDDRHELSLPGPYEPGVDQKKLTGAYTGLVEYNNTAYFDVLVDSLLKNRYFSYLHILIPVGKNNEPLMTDTHDCRMDDLYDGKCGDNGVILIEDSIQYKKFVDTITIHAYDWGDEPDEDSIEPFAWNGMPGNIHFQLSRHRYGAICFKYITTANDTVFYKSFVKDRKIAWVERKKSKYLWNKTLSYAVLPVDVVLFPFVSLTVLCILVHYKATHS